MSSGAMQSNNERLEMLRKIREGSTKRAEQQRRQREIYREKRDEDEYEQELQQLEGNSTFVIVNIIIFLFFVSLPLSEPTIDWVVVGSFVALNSIWNVAFHRPAWLQYCTLVLLNITLVQWSPYLNGIPRVLRETDPMIIASAVIGNVTLAAGLYYFYVLQKRPWAWKVKDGPSAPGKKPLKGSSGEKSLEASLAEFARKKEYTDRVDIACVIVLGVNVAALTLSGVIPIFEVLWSLKSLYYAVTLQR